MVFSDLVNTQTCILRRGIKAQLLCCAAKLETAQVRNGQTYLCVHKSLQMIKKPLIVVYMFVQSSAVVKYMYNVFAVCGHPVLHVPRAVPGGEVQL